MSPTLDYLTPLAVESERFGDLLAATDPAKPVPTCPEWSAVDLLWHLTEVQLFWGTIVRERLADPAEAVRQKPDRPTDLDSLLHLFATAGIALHDALSTTPPEIPVWTWADDRTVGFVRRRQAHEALIHRVDAELTAGVVPGQGAPIDPTFATDGVDEALRVMFGEFDDWGAFTPDGSTVRVEATDTDASWTVAPGRFVGTSPDTGDEVDEPALTVVDAAATPAAVVRGESADVDCWLWGRLGPGQLDRSGDMEVLRRLQEVVDRGLD